MAAPLLDGPGGTEVSREAPALRTRDHPASARVSSVVYGPMTDGARAAA